MQIENSTSLWTQIKNNITTVMTIAIIIISIASELVTLRLTANAHDVRLDEGDKRIVKLEDNFNQTALALNSINKNLEILLPGYKK